MRGDRADERISKRAFSSFITHIIFYSVCVCVCVRYAHTRMRTCLPQLVRRSQKTTHRRHFFLAMHVLDLALQLSDLA